MQANNIKEMREALEKMCDLFERDVICTSYANTSEEMEQIEELYRKAKAALAKPPRNCDRFTSESEMRAAFIDWYNTVYDVKGDKWLEIDSGDLKHDVDGILQDYIKWLLAPATE